MMMVGILSIIIWRRIRATSWKAFSLGILAWGFAVIPLPVAERLFALVAHVFSCVLIVYDVRIGGQPWFWLSFVYKSLLDAVAAWSLLAATLTKSLYGMMILETVIAGFAVIGLGRARQATRTIWKVSEIRVTSGSESRKKPPES
jgi:hypothetical protein